MKEYTHTHTDKHEYLTGEDLGYKPDVVQKPKFEYSPLGQVFNKGLKRGQKQVRLFKRLKHFEDKTNRQSNQNNDHQLGLKSIGYKFKEGLLQEAKIVFDKIVDKERSISYLELGFRGGNNKDYNFTNFSPLRELFRRIYFGEILISAAERKQDNFDKM